MKRFVMVVATVFLAACSKSSSPSTPPPTNPPPPPPPAVTAPSALNYATNPATYSVGVAIAPNTPTAAGSAIDSYAVTPALPPGLALDPKTGIISGTPTAVAATAAYQVTATNTAGSTSVALTITVNPVVPAAVVVQPESQDVVPGRPGFFTVLASGTPPLTYQWLNGNNPINGSNLPTFFTSPAVPNDSGAAFKVKVTDAVGSTATSAPATLHVVNGFSAGGNLGAAREGHTATVMPDGTVIVIGGQTGATIVSEVDRYDVGTKTSTVAGTTAARTNHTATLLPGNKVLVVGGFGPSATPPSPVPLATAEIYDLATQTSTPTGSLLQARDNHTATLLPNGKVLIAGGDDGTQPLASAELFDPATGTFSATGNLAVAREVHTATLLPNGKVLIAGGNSSTNTAAPVGAAELYDPATGTFTATGSTTVGRIFPTATLLPDGKVLLTGGDGATSAPLASAELYDPVAGTFGGTGNMTAARDHHSAALLPTGQVLIAGGASPGALPTAELYDPAQGTFVAASALITPREAAVLVTVPSGRAALLGGTTLTGAGTVLASVEIYDGFGAELTSTGSLATARNDHTATLLANGKVLIAGGQSQNVALASAEIYDPVAGTFASAGTMVTARAVHTATLLPSGKVLIAGGVDATGQFLSTAELYDPVANTFTATGALLGPRSGHTATLLGNGKVLIAGGGPSAGVVDRIAQLYDPAAGTFSRTGDLAAARSEHTATILPDGHVLLAGGTDGTATLATAEKYDAISGTFVAVGNLLAARRQHTASLLPTGEVLMAGGVGASGLATTAELFDPGTDTFVATGSLLFPRFAHTATTLPDGTVLVAGGLSAPPGVPGVLLSAAEIYDRSLGGFRRVGDLVQARGLHSATLLVDGKVLVAGGLDPAATATADSLTTAELFRFW